MRTSARVGTLLLLGCVALAPVLAGCNVIRRETGEASTEGVVEGMESAMPGADVSLAPVTNGFASDLKILVVVPDATAVTADELGAAVSALCEAEPVGFDLVTLTVQSGEAGTDERAYADVEELLAEAFPDGTDLGKNTPLDKLCEAAA